MKVYYSPYVFAENRGREGIWLNTSLREDKVMRDIVLKHEVTHSGRISFADLKHDFSLDDIKYTPQFIRFFFKHPQCFVLYLLPFSFSFKPKFLVYIDYTRVLLYMAFVLAVILI